jgi:uncharacterized membrane protein
MSKSESDLESGKGVDRIAAFSDAIFAFAMTLLVIGIAIPSASVAMTGDELARILVGSIPDILAYFLSFFSVGLYWFAHHRTFRYIRRSDNGLTWINLALLLFIAFTPFSSSLLIRFGDLAVAWIVFAATMGSVGIMSAGLWAYASENHRLIDPHLDPAFIRLILVRDVSTPVVFFVSIFISILSPIAAEFSPLAIPILHYLFRRHYRDKLGSRLP